MKISKNELRKMILETVLREKKDKKRKIGKKLRDAINTFLTGRETSSPGDLRGSTSSTPPLPSATTASGAPAATTSAAADTNKSKKPNQIVKEIQQLINIYYGKDGINSNKKIREDGFWGKETDSGLKDVFEYFEIPNPGRSWKEISSYLKEKSLGNYPPTIYFIK